jgi:hypothetical protein
MNNNSKPQLPSMNTRLYTDSWTGKTITSTQPQPVVETLLGRPVIPQPQGGKKS